MRIGFIGFGTMGQPMAEHLLKAGHELRVRRVDASRFIGGLAYELDTEAAYAARE